MTTDILERERESPTHPGVATAPGASAPRAPGAAGPSSVGSLAILVVPVAAACAVFAWTTALPLDLHEQALVLAPDKLPRAARAVAEIVGASPRAWRALGAVALALCGIAAFTLARALGRSSMQPLVAGGVVVTHAAILSSSAHVEGSLRLLALAATLGALAAMGRSFGRRVAAASLLALSWLLNPGFRSPGSAHDAILIVLNRRPDAPAAAIAAAAAAAAALVLVFAFGSSTRSRDRVILVAAAIAFAAMGIGTALKDGADTKAARSEVERFTAGLDALPALAGSEIVLDAPAPWADLAGARPGRRLAPGPGAATGANRIRILHWAAPGQEGPMSTLPPNLSHVVEGDIDPGIALVSPLPGAKLAARTSEDEPEFRFSLDEIPSDLGRIRIIIIAELAGRAGVTVRDLEETIVRREGTPGKPEIVWRPAWRPMSCPERELRWEDGDVCPRGRSFWWTVAVDDPGRTRIAPLRQAFLLP